ncbi:DUF308 domain-containing protein [Bradyrhizobium xenonodulans]|uniref:DUF308 domain-containing protein n=1 Tax=Bradyrhizobium xenonodulans TaxID=2736875 RepID=A0ABY7MRN2_9BRAD|nr:DUF308 domain-containing protein [Bradyrhizobium xenonodulans]WBL81043.1 DUF308 domain-containing protein [Bradyrhizobium xenonodulans]
MTLALLIAGIFAVVAGLLAIVFGYTVRDFSLGSTLIISGTIGVCSGMLLAGLHVVVVELKGIGRRLAGAAAASEVRVRPVLPGLATSGPPASEPGPAPAMKPPPLSAAGPPPWQNEAAARERPRVEAPPPPPEPEAPTPPGAPDAPRRRNLLFASTSRKERERAEAKTTDGVPPHSHDEPAEPAAPDSSPASFDDAWPRPDRMRPPEPPAAARRPPPPPRSPSTLTEASPPPPAPAVEQAPVTVLKSGIVDGMAYSLYSDGSIEAQMPEGMMRFASIDELRAHLDQRG